MKIEIKPTWSGYDVIFSAENVKVEENITERIYDVDTDGNRLSMEDIEDSALQQFVSLTDELLYYRKREFDSTTLIFEAFNKLPQDKAEEVLAVLNKDYGNE